MVEITPEFSPSMNDEQIMGLVANNCHFVFPIGDNLGELIEQIDKFEQSEQLLAISDNEGMQIDVTESQIRIRVNKTAWSSALNLDQFVELLIKQHADFKKIDHIE